mmetsp:Transcript_54892/g.101580  ORF Transcript_54892/g.101580 Transcript_54892/m.101580 type:complete len:194 (+) Transcript_54892:25-606(+)
MWQLSIERTNPGLGYIPGNVACIALEFNTPAQWSREQVLSLPHFATSDLGHDSSDAADMHVSLRRLLYSSQSLANRRGSRGRLAAGIHELTLGDLWAKWHEQKGRCAISNIRMNTQQCSRWCVSLERYDNNCGYLHGNTGLVCREFQSGDQTLLRRSVVATRRSTHQSAQWSRYKFKQLLSWVQHPTVRAWLR